MRIALSSLLGVASNLVRAVSELHLDRAQARNLGFVASGSLANDSRQGKYSALSLSLTEPIPDLFLIPQPNKPVLGKV
jgi:hypothetical protein